MCSSACMWAFIRLKSVTQRTLDRFTEHQERRQKQPKPIRRKEESRVRFISPRVVDDDGPLFLSQSTLSLTLDRLQRWFSLSCSELFVGYLWKRRDPKRDLHLLFVSPKLCLLVEPLSTRLSVGPFCPDVHGIPIDPSIRPHLLRAGGP